MPTVWTIAYLLDNGAWSPPATMPEAQISSISRKLVNQGIDTCDIAFANTRPPHVGPLTPGTVVRIVRDSFNGHDQFGNTNLSNPQGWFTGTVVAPRKTVAGGSESASLSLNGPWWYLANIVYRQQGLFYVPVGTKVLSGDVVINTDAGPVVSFGVTQVELSTQPYVLLSSDVILTQGQASGIPMDAAATLLDGLSYALQKGARLVLGMMPADQAIPSQTLTDATCAEVVKRVLRWLPSVVSWFDYKDDPPTLHFAARTDRPAFTLSMGGNAPQVQSATIQARPDLVLPGVTLQFLRRLNLTTVVSTTTTTTPAPTVEAPNPPPTSTTTYSANPPTVAGYVTTTKPPSTNKPNADTGATSSTTTSESSTAVNCLSVDAVGPFPDGIGALVATVQLQGGDVTTGVNQTPFEPTPTGLAQFIFDARKVLSFEGSVQLKAAEVIDLQNPIGRTLNISGGDDEWSAMRAEIQSSTENTATGATTLQIGPPNHLGPSDLAALLQANRLRNYVDLGTTLLRNNGGAGLPPQNPLPPAQPPTGHNPGNYGPHDPPDGGHEEGGGFAGIITPFAGGYSKNQLDGIYFKTGPDRNILPDSGVPPTFPGFGSAPPETSQGGQTDSFYATLTCDAGASPESHPILSNDTVPYHSQVNNHATHSEGSLDLTSFSALSYSYAELRGTHTYTDANGQTKTEDYSEDCTARLGTRSFYRVYASGGSPFKYFDQSGFPRQTQSSGCSISKLYLVPRKA